MGGGGGGGSRPQMMPNPYLDTLSLASQEMYGFGDTLRKGSLIDMMSMFYPDIMKSDYFQWKYGYPEEWFPDTAGAGGTGSMVGGYDPYKLPAFEPIYKLSKSGLEDQYNVARENILSSVPRGGAQADALTELENKRAFDVGALPAQLASPIIQNLYNQAQNVAWQQTPTIGLQGISSASSQLGQQLSNYQNALAAYNQSKNASSGKGGLGMLGMGVGSLLGNVFGSGPIGSAIGSGIGGLFGGGGSGGWASTPSWGLAQTYLGY